MITAIVPVRNMKNLLPRALNSLRAQTVPIREIIVADDGSTDGTYELAQMMADRVLRNPNVDEPWGICGGRNEAFKHVKTEFTLPLDADDWIDPTYIEKTLKEMTPDVGIVSTYFMYHGEKEGQIIGGPKQTYDSELYANNITVCSLVRTKAIEEAGPWDHNLRGWEDWDMWLRILRLGWEHSVVPEPLFHYRLHYGGMNAWANHPDNKQRLYGYLLAKHPNFGMKRIDGRTWNGI